MAYMPCCVAALLEETPSTATRPSKEMSGGGGGEQKKDNLVFKIDTALIQETITRHLIFASAVRDPRLVIDFATSSPKGKEEEQRPPNVETTRGEEGRWTGK